jgi:simple sugar transport system permease protein
VTVTPDPEPQSGFAAVSSFYERAGGLITPLAATVLAFFVGGLVVLATGANPLAAYKAIFNGTGLVWFFQIPWDPHSP